jgi:hypothetical protein
VPRADRERGRTRGRRHALRLRGRRARRDALAGRGDGRARRARAPPRSSASERRASRARCATRSPKRAPGRRASRPG